MGERRPLPQVGLGARGEPPTLGQGSTLNFNSLFVKYLHTQESLLLGPVKNGLYVMPSDFITSPKSSTPLQDFIGEREPVLKFGIRSLVIFCLKPLSTL